MMLTQAEADLSTISDAGQTDNFEVPFVLWDVLESGQVLTVDNTGNVSLNSFSNGKISTQWSVLLDAEVYKARLDSSGELVSIAHKNGAYVLQMSTQTLYRNISSPDPVNDAVLDAEGDLWLMFSAGKRRADQYNAEGFTGITSTTISAGISAFEILPDGRLVLASYDKKIYINSNSGALEETLSEPNAIVSSIVAVDATTIVAGTTGGTVYRYDTESWAVETLALDHSKQTTYVSSTSNYLIIGAKQGKVSFLDDTNFSLLNTFTSSGDIIGILHQSDGTFYTVGVTPDATKIRYFDLDSDLDGVNDRNDPFPNDSSQSSDSDLDGYGDNPDGTNGDAFPDDGTQWVDSDGDGYGDNALGNNPDLFPNNADQWSDQDGDGYGDNSQGLQGDKFPSESTQWADSDRDGYGDNPDGIKPDGCPTINGFSTLDRYGCPDSDLDGYSNPDANWTILQGADALPNNPTQWLDGDGDGYGDDADGQEPDACPWEYGKSKKAVSLDPNSAVGYIEIPSFGCVDEDGDGWVDRTESQGMETDPNEHFDGDGDGVGSNADYDDTKGFVQTEQDHCLNDRTDMSEACQGWVNPAYQAYLKNLEDGQNSLNYFAWNTTQQDDTAGDTTLNVDEDTLNQVILVGIIAFLGITAVILVIAKIVSKKGETTNQKTYGGYTSIQTANAAKEALEGRGGFSASGGVISDGDWEDEVEQLNFDRREDGFEDMDLKTNPEGKMTQTVTYEQESMEAIAGMPAPTPKPAAQLDKAPAPQMPSDVPPLPASGLPAGWTMEQWKWYGHEWIAKFGKN